VCYFGNHATARSVLVQGGSLDETNKFGKSVLSLCIRANRREIIRPSLGHKPSIRNALAKRHSILHVAAADADASYVAGTRFEKCQCRGEGGTDGRTTLQIFQSRESNEELKYTFNLFL
jgi:hypothetical protein